MPEQTENSNSLTEIVSLSLTVFFIWFWVNNSLLTAYSLLLTAGLIIAYFILRVFFRPKENLPFSDFLLDTLIGTAVTLLVIFLTGGLSSPLFFIIYFYLFAFALLFEPINTIVITLVLSLFFLRELNSVNTVLQLFSLLLFSPLAVYFGRQYLKLLESKQKIKILSRKARELSVISREQSADTASQETNALLWLSLDFKDSLLKICHRTAELLSDIGRLSLSQKEHLQSIHETAKNILRSGEKLKEKIDRETD